MIGYFFFIGNDIYHSVFIRHSCFLSSTSSINHGIPLSKESIRRSIALFSVRSLPRHTWVNNCDVFYKE